MFVEFGIGFADLTFKTEFLDHLLKYHNQQSRSTLLITKVWNPNRPQQALQPCPS